MRIHAVFHAVVVSAILKEATTGNLRHMHRIAPGFGVIPLIPDLKEANGRIVFVVLIPRVLAVYGIVHTRIAIRRYVLRKIRIPLHKVAHRVLADLENRPALLKIVIERVGQPTFRGPAKKADIALHAADIHQRVIVILNDAGSGHSRIVNGLFPCRRKFRVMEHPTNYVCHLPGNFLGAGGFRRQDNFRHVVYVVSNHVVHGAVQRVQLRVLAGRVRRIKARIIQFANCPSRLNLREILNVRVLEGIKEGIDRAHKIPLFLR